MTAAIVGKFEEKRHSEPQTMMAVEEKAYAIEEQYVRDELKPESGEQEQDLTLALWHISMVEEPIRGEDSA